MALPFMVFKPINIVICVGFIAFATINYLNYLKTPLIKIKENREKIEQELYKFVACIEQELLIDNDVIRIIENFKNRTNSVFKKELEITLSEMRVSNEINGLVKLESRISSSMLSDVTKGLIALTRGENNKEYFSNLINIFKRAYINDMRRKAGALPDKLKKYEILLFIGVGILILSILIADGMKSFSIIFS